MRVVAAVGHGGEPACHVFAGGQGSHGDEVGTLSATGQADTTGVVSGVVSAGAA